MSRGFASNYRIVLLAIALFACFATLGARLVCLHVIDRDQLVRKIEKTRRQETRETARRGDILDANGFILATSRSLIVVAIDPWMLRDQDRPKLPALARLVGMPLDELVAIATTRYRVADSSRKPVVAAPVAAAVPPPAATSGPLLKLNLSASPETPAAAADPEGEFARQLVAQNDEVSAPAETASGTPPVDEADAAGADDDANRRPIRWAKLSDAVSETTWAEIEKLGLRALCPPQRRYARVYPHNELASHIVGYANREGRGGAGVEAYADFYLRGQDGWREGEKDGRRREVARFQTREIPRADGYSVRLSIDQSVQDIIEREIEKIVATYQPLKATIIVSRPGTGFILGMANYPTFNPNEYGAIPKAEWNRMRNIAVADVYEPGSVFKIVAASAALDAGLVGADTLFNCTKDKVTYKDREYRLGEDHHFDHPLTVAEIIAKSSNRGAAQLAILVGAKNFDRYAREFGFGTRLGFPFGGEAPGIFARSENWHPIDITRIAMGQSIAATALQMHQAMSTIASGGVLLRPQVVSEIRDTGNNVVCRFSRAEIDRVISEKTARTMARLLQAVASRDGTAPGAAIRINGIDYEVAGKTGTAQKYLPVTLPGGRTKLMPSTRHHVVSFVGFFPASRPQVAISVIVDDADARAQNGIAYGSAVAAPVFRSIGEKLIPILSITPPNQAALELAAIEGAHR